MQTVFQKLALVSVVLLTLLVASPTVSVAQSDLDGTGANSSSIPCADFTYSPKYPEVGETVRFAVAPANLPTCKTHYVRGYIQSYIWYVGNDNIPVDGGETTATSFDKPGEHTVGLEAVNHLGERTYYERTVVVGNTPPTPRFSYAPEEPEAGQVVEFDASTSSNPEAEIEEYRWEMGDGTTGTGVRFSHAYEEPGVYEAVLTVDNGERTNSRTETVTVRNASEDTGDGGDTTGSGGEGGNSGEGGSNGNGSAESGESNTDGSDTTGSGGGADGGGSQAQSGGGNSTGSEGDGGGSESLDGLGVVVSLAAAVVVVSVLAVKRRRNG